MLLTQVAHAAPVLVVVGDGAQNSSNFVNRLRSELSAEGFTVTTVQTSDALEPSMLPRAAERYESPIIVAFNIANDQVSGYVWVADLAKGGGTIRPVASQVVSEQAPAVFAVRATDVLRGLLLELNLKARAALAPPVEATDTKSSKSSHETQKEPTSPKRQSKSVPVVAALPPDNVDAPQNVMRVWRIDLSLTLLQGFRDSPLSTGATVAVVRALRDWELGAEATLFAGDTLTPTDASAVPRTASFHQFYAGPVVRYSQGMASNLSWFGSASSGLYLASVAGSDPGHPSLNRRERTLIGYSTLGVGLLWMPSAALGLSLSTHLFTPWQPLDIRVETDGPRLARVALPMFICQLGTRVAW